MTKPKPNICMEIASGSDYIFNLDISLLLQINQESNRSVHKDKEREMQRERGKVRERQTDRERERERKRGRQR